jgi:hypothetical protein
MQQALCGFAYARVLRAWLRIRAVSSFESVAELTVRDKGTHLYEYVRLYVYSLHAASLLEFLKNYFLLHASGRATGYLYSFIRGVGKVSVVVCYATVAW